MKTNVCETLVSAYIYPNKALAGRVLGSFGDGGTLLSGTPNRAASLINNGIHRHTSYASFCELLHASPTTLSTQVEEALQPHVLARSLMLHAKLSV